MPHVRARAVKLFYIGSFGAPHSTENDVRRAFEYLGWEVDCYEERDAIREWTGVPDRALAADLVMYTSTQGLAAKNAEELWDLCEAAGIPTACYHLDLYYGLASPKGHIGIPRYQCPAEHPQFRMAYVFTADGDHDEQFAEDGVNHYWLPPAVRHDEARVIEPTAEDRQRWGGYDVAFVGSKGYHPEYPQRAQLVDNLRARYGTGFVHVGGDGDLPTLRGEELNRFYATVPVVVGDYCYAGQAQRYWSDRFPEVWGRGGFLVFPYNRALLEYLGTPYPFWQIEGGRDDLYRAVDFYLERPNWREAARRALQPLIAERHTYVNRVQTMLDVMGLA